MKKSRSEACKSKKRYMSKSRMSKTGFYIMNKAGQYLYWNKSFFKGGYHFKDGKEGSGKFTREETRRIFIYLKSQGMYDIRKKRIK